MKEMYENLCEEHRWNICADLKVTVLLTVARQIH
jgi:hypothetical protein